MKRICFRDLLVVIGGRAVTARDETITAIPPVEKVGRRARALVLAGATLLLWLQASGEATAQMAVHGDFSVSANGAAIYAIPLAVPPGTASMIPSLSLNYGSQSGNGIVGMGWSLGGLQSISRCPQTQAQDGVHGSLNNDGNDRFCIGGQRLSAINNSSYGADGTEYRTEIDSFSRVISHGAAGNGPAWFEVRTKAGRVMEFGRTSDSFVPIASGSTTARLWALDKMSDTKGNSIAITYTPQPGKSQAFPSRIDYTSNATAGLAPYASVQFSYEARSDVRPLFIAGSLIETTQRLNHIQTYVGSALVADYRLAYQQGGVTGRSRLTSFTPCGGDGSCLPATTFGWSDGNGQSDLLRTITTGLTGTTSIAYSPLTNGNVYTKDTSAVYPLQDWQGPMFVVSRVDTSNGVGGNRSSTYNYAGARVDLSGRGFLPFRQTIVTDLQTNLVQTTNYRQDYPFIGLVASETKVLGAQTLAETLNNYRFSNVGGAASVSVPSGTSAPYNVTLQQNVASGFDLDGSAMQAVNTSYQYDAYGNPTQVAASTWDGFVKTTTNTYTNDDTNWLLGRLTAASVTSQAPSGGGTSSPPPAPAADLTVSKTHAGQLVQGQTGVVYTITVSNVGAWPTVGAVSVADTLPTGLSAVSMLGSGWSCTFSTLTCTRSDPLAGGASYPAVTLTVGVASNAPASLTNIATVSGGGDSNAANNTASDAAAVTQVVTIATSTNNLNLWNYLVATGKATAGQPGTWVVTINGGVVIGSASTGAYAFDTGVFPAGSTLQIVNNGIITGAGGNGGAGGPTICFPGNSPPPPGNAGGPGLHVQTPVTIANNGSIWGGGGGGSGGYAETHLGSSAPGAGGGGGAGAVPGAGGVSSSVSGASGSLSAGGAGGVYDVSPAGAGGAPGSPGGAEPPSYVYLGGQKTLCATSVGGAAGASVIGNSMVTWSNVGDIRGPMPPAPLVDVTIVVSHGLDFAQGQSGATYTLSVSNVGAFATAGAVSVTDTLPTGLTATSMSGSGWSCTLATLTCTRGDSLAGGASYPAITLTVNVASNAPASVTNAATVSGGGDANSSNNSSSDPTAITPTVVPPTAVTIASSTNNLNLWNYLVATGNATAGQAGKWVVTISGGVVIGSASTGAYAFDTGVFPSGSTLQIVNNGIITGAGGNGGGAGGLCYPGNPAPPPGSAGGPGLRVQTPVTIANNGSIWGGGGGGSGGYGVRPGLNSMIPGGGGGGGAGAVPGAGGVSSSASGASGSLSAGGAGGVNGYYSAGAGGAPGSPGGVEPPLYVILDPSTGRKALCATGVGGGAGASVVGNSFVTWGSAGDIRGALQ